MNIPGCYRASMELRHACYKEVDRLILSTYSRGLRTDPSSIGIQCDMGHSLFVDGSGAGVVIGNEPAVSCFPYIVWIVTEARLHFFVLVV